MTWKPSENVSLTEHSEIIINNPPIVMSLEDGSLVIEKKEEIKP